MIARTTFGRILAVALAACVSPAPAALATGSHLVDTRQVAARLAEESAARRARVAQIQDVLERGETRRQAGLLGLDVQRLRAAVPHLSDAELQDLSQRAANVKDVAAGYHDDALVIVGIVLLLAGLAVLVAVGDDGYYDDCYCY